MRVGFGSAAIVLLVLMVIVAGFGYLFYGYMDTSEELKVISKKATQLEQENQVLKEQVDDANADVMNLKIQVDDLNQQVLFWKEQAHQYEGKSQILEEQNVALEIQNQSFEDRNKELEEQVKALNSTMKAQYPTKNANSLNLGLLIPILPVAIAATYTVTRWQTINSSQKNQRIRSIMTQRGNMVQLSENEMKEIIKIRRGQSDSR